MHLDALLALHGIRLLKMLLAYLIPDQPRWVVDAVARKEFSKEMREYARRRASTVEQINMASDREKQLKIEAIVQSINASDDAVSAAGPRAASETIEMSNTI